MKNEISIILLYIIGFWGSGHHIKKKAKKHPIKNAGIEKLFANPTNPEKDVNVIIIFHPIIYYAQLPIDQMMTIPITKVVRSWKTNWAVINL